MHTHGQAIKPWQEVAGGFGGPTERRTGRRATRTRVQVIEDVGLALVAVLRLETPREADVSPDRNAHKVFAASTAINPVVAWPHRPA